MVSPIARATIQAAILSAISNILAQFITCYQAGTPYRLNVVTLGHFVTYSLMSCPPNWLWQQWLEASFPGYTLASEPGTADSLANDPTVKLVTDKAGPAFQALNEKTAPALQALNDRTAPALQALNDKTAPALQALNDKATPALQALSDKASAATTAIQENEVVQIVKRRATEGVETVKSKAMEFEALTAGKPNNLSPKSGSVTRAQTFSTPDGQTIEKRDDGGAPQQSQKAVGAKKLNIKNTAIKFSLDQTFGAVINNLLFIIGIGALRGRPVLDIAASVKSDFLPLLFAGQRLWPAVSLISFTMVPVEHRTVFGGIVGVGWGIFLSLLAGGKR